MLVHKILDYITSHIDNISTDITSTTTSDPHMNNRYMPYDMALKTYVPKESHLHK